MVTSKGFEASNSARSVGQAISARLADRFRAHEERGTI